MSPVYAHWDDSHALDWRRSFGPPVRPTAAECRIYRRELIRLGKTANVLLMGSTPELREIVADLSFYLTVMDVKEKNYDDMPAMSGSTGHREKYLKMNWLDMRFDSEFDYIIGDNVLSILPPSDAAKIIENVHRALKPGARWITRVMVYNEGEDFISPDTLNGRIGKCTTKKDIYEQLYVSFLSYYKNEIGSTVISEVYDRLKRDVDRGIFPSLCLEVFRTLSDYKEENYLVERKQFERTIGERFSIIRSHDSTQPFSKNWVIYVLGKK